MGDKLMQLGVFALLAAGLVVLVLEDKGTTEYVSLLGPLAAGLLVVQRVEKRSDKQDEKLEHQDAVLDEIHENTNGVLTKRIKEAVQEVLDERERR